MRFIKRLCISLLALNLYAPAAMAQTIIHLEGTPQDGDQFGRAVAAGDFNCDDFDDMAVGEPFQNFSGLADVGFINIVYGGTGNGSQLSALGNSYINVTGGFQSYLQFGGVLAVGDFDGDGCDDLATGMPYKNIGSDVDAGEVQVFYGHPGGPRTPAEVWNQDTAGVDGGTEYYDNFGASLAAGDYNGDGYDDLAIGVPGENNGVGYVFMLSGQPLAGLTTMVTRFFSQDSTGIFEVAESGDRFGHALASGDFNGDGYDDLAIGAPFEGRGSYSQSGLVHILNGSSNFLSATGSQAWDKSAPGISGEPGNNYRFGYSLAAGDFNNDGRDDLAIGMPYDGYHQSCSGQPGGCTTSYTGAVLVLQGTATGLSAQNQQYWQPDSYSRGYDGLYGWALVAADFNGDNRDDLAIGAPEARIYEPTLVDPSGTGAVYIHYGAASGLASPAALYLHQNVAGVEGGVEFGDNFGWSLAAGDFNSDGRADLVVGVPTEFASGVWSGVVQVFYGAAGTLNPANDQMFAQ